MLKNIHHVAIICSDYEKSKSFYTQILGFKIENEVYREERQSFMLDLSLNDIYTLELFSFPNPPVRPSRPEAVGLRHIAFGTEDIEEMVKYLNSNEVVCEPIMIDPYTQKNFTFFQDPDGLPIELYEVI